jgi:hypothetical protein
VVAATDPKVFDETMVGTDKVFGRGRDCIAGAFPHDEHDDDEKEKDKRAMGAAIALGVISALLIVAVVVLAVLLVKANKRPVATATSRDVVNPIRG